MVEQLSKAKDINKSDFWVFDKGYDYYINICEGTGDNLSVEDLDEGYCDYIYYSIYGTIDDIRENMENDGGLFLLKKYYAKLSIETILKKLIDFGVLSSLEEITILP